jgi:hypothetical protein
VHWVKKSSDVARVAIMWVALLGIPYVLHEAAEINKYHPQLNTVLLLFIIWVLLLKQPKAD